VPTIWCIFRNFASHAKELENTIPPEPKFFIKPASSINQSDGNGNTTVKLPNYEHIIHHEVEMVVSLNENLRPNKVCIGIDMTNRTVQTEAKSEGWPWLESKGFKESAVLGTWAKWKDGDYHLELYVNKEKRQSDSTSLMLNSIDTILESLNCTYELNPNDLIFTGTPAGVGALKKGDIVDATLKNSEGIEMSILSAIIE